MLRYTITPQCLAFKQPAGTSRGVYRQRLSWIVRFYPDSPASPADDREEGRLFGVGECAPLPDLSVDALPPADYEALLHQCCREVCRTGRVDTEALRPYPSILFGLETALLSLEAARQTGDPLRLFDTPFTRGERGIPINGLIWMGNFEEMQRRLEEKLAAGFHCIKLKIGAIDFDSELELLRAVRRRFGPESITLRVDANGAFTPQEAPRKLEALAQFSLHSIEQPLRAGQWEAMRQLCATTPLPIALDEELIGINRPEQKVALLQTIRPQYLVLKPSLHGGLSGAEEWIRLAQEHGTGYWVTSALEGNCGLNALAAWTSTLPPFSSDTEQAIKPLHQGLGTGALFVSNFPGTALHIRGEELWSSRAEDFAFGQQVAQFRHEWLAPTLTMQVQTSGSTGQPKQMEVQKEWMWQSALRTCRALHLPQGADALLCLPIRYIAAQMMAVRAEVWPLRLTMVHPSSHPLRHLDHAPYFVAMTPMQAYATLQDQHEAALLRQVRVLLLGGGEISPALETQLHSLPGDVWSSYGMTETLSNVALRRISGPSAGEWYVPMEGVSVEIGDDGTLTIHDPLTGNPTLHTNDMAETNGTGGFRILGRRDNVVCSGGIKLQLEALERRLRQRLSCDFFLTARPDDRLGQALTLVFQGESTEVPRMEAACRSVLHGPEVPRRYEAVRELPRTISGKVRRFLKNGEQTSTDATAF